MSRFIGLVHYQTYHYSSPKNSEDASNYSIVLLSHLERCDIFFHTTSLAQIFLIRTGFSF